MISLLIQILFRPLTPGEGCQAIKGTYGREATKVDRVVVAKAEGGRKAKA